MGETQEVISEEALKCQDLAYLKEAVKVSESAMENGNTPFGAILVGPKGEILLRGENVERTDKDCSGHAETALMRRATELYDREFLWSCVLYTSVEPCAMCAGAIFWGNVGTVVYGLSETQFLNFLNEEEKKGALNLPCREVFARGPKNIEVRGPYSEIEEEASKAHRAFWGK